MAIKRLKGPLAILLLSMISLALLVSVVVAKPLGINPAQTFWPPSTVGGTNLRFENSDNPPPSISEIYWGVGGVSDTTIASAPDPPAGLVVEFVDDIGNNYATWVKAAAAEPASYTWSVQFRKVKNTDPKGGKVSSTMENIDTRFVPQDYSVVLENTDLGIHINLRTGSENVQGTNIRLTPILAALNVDNAVNIQSIENLDPLTGKPGNTLRLRVTVKNTGRYTDNYSVSTGGSLDPTILNLAPGNQDNVTLSTTLPAGTNVPIVVTAAGNYATDQDYVTASGIPLINLTIQITPNENVDENGKTLTFDVLVKNSGDIQDNYSLTVENIWERNLSSTQLDNVNPGENRHVTLSVKIPDNAKPGDSDNITVTATSKENDNFGRSATCTAVAGFYSVQVSILPSYQENVPGGMLNYTVRVSNKGTIDDVYTLTRADNIDENNYWEDNISLDNTSLAVPAGDNRTTMLRVTIPDNSIPSTDDNIAVTATSQSNNKVENSTSCIAHVALVRVVQVSIDPQFQENDNGGTLKYDVTVKNLGDVTENFQFTKGDNTGWALSLDNIWLLVPKGGTGTTKLTVIIPVDAASGTLDNIWVQATSIDNAALFDNESCLAQVAILRGVQVVIDPSPPAYLENEYGGTVKFTVTVKNLGMIQENFQLTKGDNAGWTLNLDNNWLVVPSGENMATKLTVTLPSNGAPVNLIAGWNLVSFTAVSPSDTPSSLFTGLNYLTDYIIYYWTAPIGPYILQGFNQAFSDNLGYWIFIDQNKTVRTTGVRIASRDIKLITGWNLAGFPAVSDNTTPNNLFTGLNYLTDYIIYSWSAPNGPYILQGNNQVLKDNVGYWIWLNQNKTITSSAILSTWDNIWVRATSKDDPTVFDNESCLAHIKSVVRGVSVSISPSSQSGANGATLTYTVTINNTGNVSDNYSLTTTDTGNWSPSVLPTSVVVPAFSSDSTTTLRVTSPGGAADGDEDGITVTANGTADNGSGTCTATVTIARSVSVSISPSSKSGANGATLTYTVTVHNTGNVSDIYTLDNTDTLLWTKSLSNTSVGPLSPSASNSSTTLSVTLPSNAIGGTADIITVTANGTGDNASASCTATLNVNRSVSVSISPSSQSGANGATLTYTVTVTNTGNVSDNYKLENKDNLGWTNLSKTSVVVAAFSSDNTTKENVTIPTLAIGGTIDNIKVKATSQTDNMISGSDNCTAQVTIASKVSVSISPTENSALPGNTLTFTVAVTNKGDNVDNYILHASDNLGWNLSLFDNLLENVSPGGTLSTALTVAIPGNAAPNSQDNIIVTAASQDNENITGNATCIALSIATTRGVSVSISPADANGMPGDTPSFKIRVVNTGNMIDNYDLIFSDNAGWNPSISESALEIPAGDNRSVTLAVTVPDNTIPGTVDKLSVTVTSHEDATVSSSATCMVLAMELRRVEITISPDYRNGPAGAMLNYTVRVTNTGRAADNYKLVVNGTTSWRTSIAPDSLALDPGQSGEATLTITVPSGASGSSMIFYVWAISSTDQTVRNDATCRAVALVIGEGAGLSIPWFQIILIAAIIIGVVFAVGYLTRIRERKGRKRPKVLTAVFALAPMLLKQRVES